MEKNENKKNRQKFGVVTIIVIIICIALLSRRLHKSNSSYNIVTNEQSTSEEDTENISTDTLSGEETVKLYYSSLENYIDGTQDDILYITSNFPDRYRNDIIKKEMIDSLEYIKENNITFDLDNATFLTADIEKNRVEFTDNHYISTDFEDIKVIIVTMPLQVFNTTTDAISSTNYMNNVLIANYKGSWYVIPEGHYYFN